MTASDPSPTPRQRLVELLPWLFVAALLHVAAFLALSLWKPNRAGPGDTVIPVSIVTTANPFVDAAESGAETPVDRQPEPLADPVDAIPPNDAPADDSPAATAGPNDAVEQAALESGVPSDPSADLDLGLTATGPAMDPYANRGDRQRQWALDNHGGSAETESGVAAGLAWLAAHQDGNGSWDRAGFSRHCPPEDPCGGAAVRWTELDARPGVTAVATLAFLGAGNTHRAGPYAQVVRFARDYLLSRQRENGSFSQPDRMEMYNDAIATLALGELYALTRDPVLAAPLARAVEHLVRAQQAGGGWDYRSDLATGRCDTSVTGWVVMALKSARTAGVRVPDRTILGVFDHFTEATDSMGRVYYANTGTGTRDDAATRATVRRYGPAMTAVGMLSRLLLGWRSDSSVIADQAALLLAEPPDIRRLQGGDATGLHSYYYWYHASLGLFLRGGPDWEQWNATLRDAVLSTQDSSRTGAGKPRHRFGSWPALGPGWGSWGRTGGRVYTTALNVLTLETYYRYLPAYASAKPLLSARTLRLALQDRRDGAQHRIAAAAGEMSAVTAEPALVDALQLPDARTQLWAALGLARFDNPLGMAVLERHLVDAVGQEHRAIADALARLSDQTWGPDYGAVIRVDPDRALAVFETGGRAVYLGQSLTLLRDGIVVGGLTVVLRPAEEPLAVGRLSEGSSGKTGDTVHVDRGSPLAPGAIDRPGPGRPGNVP
ncbi:MAG: hypothetical protein GY778_03695 [bacterium]|nr:hypothetical protein [bacterium]